MKPGEVLGIIGLNGTGKTSLFEVLCGRLFPKSGDVIFRGRDITKLRLYERARLGLGRTYQTPVVPDEWSVGEALKAARQAYKPDLTAAQAEWGAQLARFRVNPRLPTAQLDTSQRRKLILFCLLMRHPPSLQGNEHRHCDCRTPD